VNIGEGGGVGNHKIKIVEYCSPHEKPTQVLYQGRSPMGTVNMSKILPKWQTSWTCYEGIFLMEEYSKTARHI
jgi:hypothetical protein